MMVKYYLDHVILQFCQTRLLDFIACIYKRALNMSRNEAKIPWAKIQKRVQQNVKI